MKLDAGVWNVIRLAIVGFASVCVLALLIGWLIDTIRIYLV